MTSTGSFYAITFTLYFDVDLYVELSTISSVEIRHISKVASSAILQHLTRPSLMFKQNRESSEKHYAPGVNCHPVPAKMLGSI